MEHVQPQLPYEYLLHVACDCCEVLARDCERVNCTNNNEAIFISGPKAFRAFSKFAAINKPGFFLECVYSPFVTYMPHAPPFHWEHAWSHPIPGEAYKRANLLQSLLVPPPRPSHKQDLPMFPETEVSAQVFHVNSLGAWLNWVGTKSSIGLTEELCW